MAGLNQNIWSRKLDTMFLLGTSTYLVFSHLRSIREVGPLLIRAL